jgi:fumarylacetoacetate (FAA) hydrolase
MKLVTFSASGKSTQPGLMLEDRVLPLPFDSMLDLIKAGEKGLETVRRTPVENSLQLDEVRLHAPIPRPPTLRDFYAFEQHVRTANENRGRSVPENWYKFPVFYFANPNSIFGTNEEIPYPPYTQALDYELEIAAVIGNAGINITPETAPKHIFGYTIFNDWSARDVQREEMQVHLGPAKGKDFASSFGPCIVTADEFSQEMAGKPGVYEAAMIARINGEERSRGNFKDIYWSFGQMIQRASESVMLYPGDVIGSGTVGTGCLLELTKAQGPWLKPGDLVELEIEGIGVLRNTVQKP